MFKVEYTDRNGRVRKRKTVDDNGIPCVISISQVARELGLPVRFDWGKCQFVCSPFDIQGEPADAKEQTK